MNKIVIFAVIIILGWQGNLLYSRGDLKVIQDFISGPGSNEQVKCITRDDRVLYGDIPQGTV